MKYFSKQIKYRINIFYINVNFKRLHLKASYFNRRLLIETSLLYALYFKCREETR